MLGAFVAHRPWRRLVGNRAPRVQPDTAQTQSIIAVAGALLVVVIGDSLARAFGLVGLGTFIRFRAGVKDPRDVAVLFVMIGIGMACGLGLLGTAVVGTLFVACVLATLRPLRPAAPAYAHDHRARPGPGRRCATPCAPPSPTRAPWTCARRARRPRLVRIAATDDEDALTILEALRTRGRRDIKAVRVEEE